MQTLIQPRFQRLAAPVLAALLLGFLVAQAGAAHSQTAPPETALAASQAPGATNFGSAIETCSPPIQPVPLVNPIVVTDCTQAGVQTALDAGGHIRFDCGPGQVTIPLSSQLELSTSSDTVLDGGGLVTLDGQGVTRILHKGWHDPVSVGTVRVTIQNLRFVNGKAPSGGGTGDHSGGAIASGHPGTYLHILNSTFENNATTDVHTPDNQGGAIFSSNSHETVIVDSIFQGNSAGNGGAMGGIATGLLIFNTRFSSNQAVDNTGGGIVRGYGGAIHLDGVTNSYNPNSNRRVHVCGSLFEDNTAIRGGGAMGVVISDNKGTLATYERSTFKGNQVLGLGEGSGQGGALYHIEDDHAGAIGEDNLEILDCTFHNNEVRYQGGAVWVYILGHGQVSNVTFEGNRTTAPFNTVGQGGAMVVTLGLIDITNVTFANNHAAYQAGALHGGGSGDYRRVITLKNTIFLDNTLNYGQTWPSETEWQGYHTNRPMTDGGQNIQQPRFKPVYNNEVNNSITANPLYVDPRLRALADNGGPTLTMALKGSSPAIDTGAAGCPTRDQRGISREGTCDIGPYEYISPYLQLSPGGQAIDPGGAASYTLQMAGSAPPTSTLTLGVDNPYPDLIEDLSPSSLAPGGSATLTLTDTHPGPSLVPGLWHLVTVSASGAGGPYVAEAALIVGGSRLYLPVVSKE